MILKNYISNRWFSEASRDCYNVVLLHWKRRYWDQPRHTKVLPFFGWIWGPPNSAWMSLSSSWPSPRSSRTGWCGRAPGVTSCGTAFLGASSPCLSTLPTWGTSLSITPSSVSAQQTHTHTHICTHTHTQQNMIRRGMYSNHFMKPVWRQHIPWRCLVKGD